MLSWFTRRGAPGTSPDRNISPSFAPAATLLDGLEPQDFVRAYIADYERWNAFSHEASAQDPIAGMTAAETAYATLLAKFCLPDHSCQPVAFGSEPAHDNARESIIDIQHDEDNCVVRTGHTKTAGQITVADDYEYHLKKVGQRWYLTSVLYVDEEGKYEEL